MESAGRNRPKVSVVLPVRNEACSIADILGDLSVQEFPRDDFEVIVADGMSEDDTVAIARTFRGRIEHLVVLPNSKKLASAGRNVAIRAARGDFVLIIDGHCRLPSEQLLRDAIKLFEQYAADVLCRPLPRVPDAVSTFQEAVALARASSLGHALDSTIYMDKEQPIKAASSGAFYRRQVFETIGYFDESFDACEDVEFNTRADYAGLRAVISPKLMIQYEPRSSLRALFRQLYRYGYGRWKLFRKHPATLGFGTLIPVAFVVGIAALLPLWLISYRAGLLLLMPYLAYAAAVLYSSAQIAAHHGRSMFFVLPAIYFTIHFAFGVGFIVSALKSQRR